MKKVMLVFPDLDHLNDYIFSERPKHAFTKRMNLSVVTFLDDDAIFLAGTKYQAEITFLDLGLKSTYLADRFVPFCTIYPQIWGQAV
ncbi:hypothetical protein BUE76_07950 [Cnuella takakiae]|nr:hypothetical protein BUE76_07950 [Cnuella takakiae]